MRGTDETLAVLIIGAGFSGLCMAIRLKEAGIGPFLVLEKADEVGGTWRENTYPGCACDIPSHLYSLSFEPRADWSRLYPSQPELLTYLRAVAAKHDLYPRIRFGTAMASAAWDEREGVWRVEASDGTLFRARVLVSGIGALHVPARPAIPGMDRFQGALFHSAEWPRGWQGEGKRIAVIGTGASAIQLVPEIAPAAARLHVFQRTPPWIVPKPDRPVGVFERRLLALPPYRALFRSWLYWLHELRALALLGEGKVAREAAKLAENHLAAQVPEGELRRKLTPDYRVGCKRILLSDDYYPTLHRPNVELVTEGIAQVTGDGVRTADGAFRAVDAIILATGFDVVGTLRRVDVTGRGGVRLAEAWREDARSHYGIAVSGFPNFFMLLGPNTGLGHNSVVLMIEAQVRYVISALRLTRRRGLRELEVRPEVEAAFGRELQRRLARTVWQAGGCRSWYRDEAGRNVTLWPGFTFDYRWRTRRARASDFVLRAPAQRAV